MIRVVTRHFSHSVFTKDCLIANHQQLRHLFLSRLSLHNHLYEKQLQSEQKQEKKTELVSTQADLSKEDYFKNRSSEIRELIKTGEDPYPHKFNVSLSVPEFINKFRHQVTEGEIIENQVHSIAGRIIPLKNTDSEFIYYDLHSEGQNIRVEAQANHYEDSSLFKKDINKLHCGDIIGVVGVPTKSKTGELSIIPRKIKLLSPCLQSLTLANANLANKETKFRQRYLDLILNSVSRKKFFIRAETISYIRKYLNEMEFLEIETPVMNVYPSGDNVKPFVSSHDELNIDLFMRISPDLYHKALIGEGIERVYEIGRKFVNKKIDKIHNSEFTTCEFFMAHADYNDLMSITEDMLSGIVKKITGSYKVQYHPDGPEGEVVEIDFTPPFKRISLMKTLEDKLNIKLPPANELNTPESNKYFDDLCIKHNVKCQAPRTTARLLDKLVGVFLEKICINPTFIIDHPEIMSPLAKGHRFEKGLTERFELFVMKNEIGSAYSVLNNPFAQAKNNAVKIHDEDFRTTPELGLPTLAGLVLGIDRLAMILTDSNDIKEVILFPTIKPNSLNIDSTS